MPYIDEVKLKEILSLYNTGKIDSAEMDKLISDLIGESLKEE